MNNSTSRAIQQAISYQFQSLGIVCPVPAGTWNATTSYRKLNIVRTAHASYIAKQASLNIEPGVTSGWEDYWQLNASDGTGGGEAFYPDQIYSQLGAGLDGDGNVITATYATKTENDAKVTSTILQNVVYIHNATQDSTMPFSATPTANSIVSRDQNGDFTVNAPSADANPATKAYVDSADESLQADITEAQSDIAALQTQTADLSQSVDDIYTILQQEVYNAQDIEQEYSSRETADGADIIDGALETVKKIQGATVKTTNQFDISQLPEQGGKDNALSVDGTIITVTNYYACNTMRTFRQLVPNAHAGTYTIFFELSTNGTFSSSSGMVALVGGGSNLYLSSSSFVSGGAGSKSNVFTVTESDLDRLVGFYGIAEEGITVSWTNLMIVEGDQTSGAAPAYSPYFPGLKNAYFQGLRSTGRNLIPFPYYTNTVTTDGITYTANNNGAITANGELAPGLFAYFRMQNQIPINQTPLRIGDHVTVSAIFPTNIAIRSGVSGQFLDSNRDIISRLDSSYNSPKDGIVPDSTVYVTIYFYLYNDTENVASINNATVYPMLNYGTSALPYEPYVSHEISLDTAIELPAWDSIDLVRGKRTVQSNTITFDGTENWAAVTANENYFFYVIQSGDEALKRTSLITNKLNVDEPINTTESGCYFAGIPLDDLIFFFLKTAYPDLSTVDAWEQQLAAWATAGDPLTVCYQTATATESDISMEDRLPAYKNGSETVIQGATDNSKYGAENTLTQNYAEVRGTTETTEGGANS